MVAAVAVNPVDFKLRSGIVARDLPLSLLYVPGADFSGAITAVGAGVSESRIASKTIVLPNDAAIADAGPYDCVVDTVGGELVQSLVKYLRPHGRFRTVVGQVPNLPVGSAISVGYVIVTSGAWMSG